MVIWPKPPIAYCVFPYSSGFAARKGRIKNARLIHSGFLKQSVSMPKVFNRLLPPKMIPFAHLWVRASSMMTIFNHRSFSSSSKTICSAGEPFGISTRQIGNIFFRFCSLWQPNRPTIGQNHNEARTRLRFFELFRHHL